ncbi:FAD-linked oxidase [Balamuthia mandrillaris]
MTAFFFIFCSLFLSFSFVPYITSSPPCPALPAAAYSFAQVYNSSSPEFSTTQKLDWNQALSYSPCAVLSIPSIGALQSLLPLLSSSPAASCPWNVRSGRHSYEGLSSSPNSLVLDVSSLRTLSFHSEAQPQQRQQEDRTQKRTASISTIVKVGPGVCMMELYSFLLDHRFIFPGGTCPTVGVHGYVLGGGFGFLSRRMGLGADNLVAAKVVLANGTLVSCSPKERPDLFFALRGGGNGNFGVVVELQLRVWPLPSSPRSLPSGKRKDGGFQHVSLSWGRNETVPVLARWQRWAPFADTRLTSQLNVYEGNVGVIAQWMADDEKELQQELKRLLVGLSPQPTEFQVKKMSAAEAIVEYAGCSTAEECLAQCMERPSSETKNRLAWKSKSIFASRFLEDAEIEELVSWMREREKVRPCCKGQFAGFMLDAFGGAIAKVPVKETAFPHRDALFLMQLMGYWNINDNPQAAENQAATLEWLQGAYATATKLLSPLKAYRNYDDRDLAANYMDAYYGPNARALAVVKQKYDPEDPTNNRE